MKLEKVLENNLRDYGIIYDPIKASYISKNKESEYLQNKIESKKYLIEKTRSKLHTSARYLQKNNLINVTPMMKHN